MDGDAEEWRIPPLMHHLGVGCCCEQRGPCAAPLLSAPTRDRHRSLKSDLIDLCFQIHDTVARKLVLCIVGNAVCVLCIPTYDPATIRRSSATKHNLLSHQSFGTCATCPSLKSRRTGVRHGRPQRTPSCSRQCRRGKKRRRKMRSKPMKRGFLFPQEDFRFSQMIIRIRTCSAVL